MATRRKFDFKFKETVLKYAEENSAEKTARLFNIDSKRVRDWRKQKEALLRGDQGRARLAGGGRKKVSVELEERLSEWISSMRDKHKRVSRSMIKKKALEIYPSVSDGGKAFVASTGWLQKFLERNDLSHRGRTVAPQEDPNVLTDRLVWFIDYVGKTVSSRRILERDIIVMDETAICFGDMAPPTAEGHKSSSLTVVLAAKVDGAKLKPFIIFRGADGDMEATQQEISGAVIDTSVNGRMSDALTARWLRSVVGQSNATPRLLVWDSHRCHVGPATKAELECGYDIMTAAIPGGCGKYVQPSDLMWKQPFRQNVHDAYEQWAAGGAEKEHTSGGSLKPPARRLLVDWVVAAWDKLDTDTIKNSFNMCGLCVKSDGSEDRLIVCVREGRRRAAGREELSQSGEHRAAPKDVNNELCLDEDEEEGEEKGEGPAHC